MSRFAQSVILGWMACLLLLPLSARAARPGKNLAPVTTKGFVSIPDFDLMREKWNETQLGQMVADPLMQPFVEDLRRQLKQKFGRTSARLSITMADLDGVYGGEVAVAMIQPGGDANAHALALLVDVTGKVDKAQELLDQVSRDLTADGARRSEKVIDGTKVISFVLPREPGEKTNREAHYFIRDNQLVACDHAATTLGILKRFDGEHTDNLAAVAAFDVSMKRCQAASGNDVPHIRWFVEPFGYVEVSRAAQGGRRRRGTDMLKVLANQGFTAIQGVGGFLFFMHDGNEIRHRTSIYAPPVKPGEEKYELAANMLEFPNRSELTPQSWVPSGVSSYLTFSWDMQQAFKYSKTLVDEVAGAPVFDDIMDSLKHDANGPQVDVYNEFVKFLGERVTFFSDVRTPVTPDSERWLMGFEVTNADIVTKTLNKAMAADPDARKRIINGRTVWEIVEEEEPAEFEALNIAGPGFGEFGNTAPVEEQEEKPLLPNSALTVAFGNLVVTSHVDYMEEVLKNAEKGDSLTKGANYQIVAEAVGKISPEANSFHYFSRTEESYHPTYELIRQGKMPEAKTLFGGLLNRLLAPEEENTVRKQEIDGRKLPEFDKVKHYFGPAGMAITSLPDGWMVNGCLLKRPTAEEAGPLVSKRTPELR